MTNLRIIAGRPCNDHLYAEALPPVLTDELKHRRTAPLWKRAARWLGEALFGTFLIVLAAACFVVIVGRFG